MIRTGILDMHEFVYNSIFVNIGKIKRGRVRVREKSVS